MNLPELLQIAEYPADTCVVDWETYFTSDYNLRKTSISEYVTDEKFRILGVAIKVNKKPVTFLSNNSPTISQDFLAKLQEYAGGYTIINHNSLFDALIAKRLGLQWPYVLDTLAMARHFNSRRHNDLKRLSHDYKLPAKGDTLQFRGLKEPTDALAEYANQDAENTYSLAEIFAEYMTNPKLELWLMQHTLGLFLDPVLRINDNRAVKIQNLMQRKIVLAMKKAGTSLEEVNSPIKLKARLEAMGVDVPMKPGKPKNGKPHMIPAFAKTDYGYQLLADHDNSKVRELIQARKSAKSWPKLIKRIHNIVHQTWARGNKLPVPLKYYGASTGRWAGTEKTNLQNLSKRSDERLVRQVRSIIYAPPAHRLVIVDAAQIEARGVVWIAEQEEALKEYREYDALKDQPKLQKMKDRYRLLATEVYRCLVEDVIETQRTTGKILTLGCGYGMGAVRCVDYAKTTFKVDMTVADATKYIKIYRAQNPKVVKFWYSIENAFKFVMTYKTPRYLSSGRIRVSWVPGRDVIALRLPNTRVLYYHSPRMQTEQGRSHLSTEFTPHLWGGLLTENIVQAISRDILGEAIYAMEHENIPVALHVHDETISVIPLADAESVMKRVEEIFSIIPSWAEGWPLGAGGKIVERYGK